VRAQPPRIILENFLMVAVLLWRRFRPRVQDWPARVVVPHCVAPRKGCARMAVLPFIRPVLGGSPFFWRGSHGPGRSCLSSGLRAGRSLHIRNGMPGDDRPERQAESGGAPFPHQSKGAQQPSRMANRERLRSGRDGSHGRLLDAGLRCPGRCMHACGGEPPAHEERQRP
jgi:hypothetical protein